jgi:hypothetical protein
VVYSCQYIGSIAANTICFQAFEQLLFQLFMAVFALLFHLGMNCTLFVPGKLGKPTELAHHDLHNTNKETQLDYVGWWQQHVREVAMTKTGLQWYIR